MTAQAHTAVQLPATGGIAPEPVLLPRVLCVDDDRHVLAGLRDQLHKHYRLSVATGAVEALDLLRTEGPFAVVISDMRMPDVNGAIFLGRVRQEWPETVRLLLTGYTDVEAARAAVNEGNIFRFLLKPCPPGQLHAAVAAAAEQHRLVCAERVLLEQTLRGSVAALVDVLALSNPLAFGRATRIRQTVMELAERTGLADRWQLEVAALLSQIGCITLPPATVGNLHAGNDLTEEELALVARLPLLAERLLAHIPRLEEVRAMLRGCFELGAGPVGAAAAPGRVRRASQMLRLAMDYDQLCTAGRSLDQALAVLRSRVQPHDAALLAALAELRGAAARSEVVKEMPLRLVTVGMTLAQDVRLQDGTLLAARGYEVTEGFVERASFLAGVVAGPVRVTLRSRRESGAAMPDTTHA